MNKVANQICDDLNLMKKVKSCCEELLPLLPPGSLNIKSCHGSVQYFHIISVKGQPSRQIYIKKSDSQLVEKLRQKVFLKKLHTVLVKNIKASEKFLAAYQPWDHDDMLPLLPQMHGVASGNFDPGKGTVRSTFFAENLRFETLSGDKVRSKSEVILADTLFYYKLDFNYEKPLDFGVVPDFTVQIPDGSIIVWEHFGMLSDTAYRQRMFEKLSLYQQHGFVPGRNLIMSFDGPDGSISSREISRLIEAYISPYIRL